MPVVQNPRSRKELKYKLRVYRDKNNWADRVYQTPNMLEKYRKFYKNQGFRTRRLTPISI
jgi:hypothetical protein